jgi:CheY-like chemotaxis protein
VIKSGQKEGAPAVALAHNGQPPAATPTRTILIIDDDAALLELVSWALEDAGYTVAAVTSGREALQWIQAAAAVGEPPVLILLDLAMPGMSGQQVAAALRGQCGAMMSPIVVISGDRQAEQRGRELGAACTLSKPFPIERLLKVVQQFAA